MDLRFSPSQEAFRDEVRGWLADNLLAEPLPPMDTPEGFERHRQWERELHEARWSVVSWPETYGRCDQLWLKRGWVLGVTWGDARWHRRRIATRLGLSA